MKSHKGSNVVTQKAVTHRDSETAVTQRFRKKADYYPRRRENCFNSFFNWNIYSMVPVSINLFIPRIPNHCLHFKTLKLESQIVKARRNVFSLGYFKTWSLRQSFCRQISQQASLDGLRYSLAGEMVFK